MTTTHPPAEPLPGIVDPERGLALPLFDIADRRPAPELAAHPCPACGRPLPHHHLTECRPCRDHGITAPQLEPQPDDIARAAGLRIHPDRYVAWYGRNRAVIVEPTIGADNLPTRYSLTLYDRAAHRVSYRPRLADTIADACRLAVDIAHDPYCAQMTPPTHDPETVAWYAHLAGRPPTTR